MPFIGINFLALGIYCIWTLTILATCRTPNLHSLRFDKSRSGQS